MQPPLSQFSISYDGTNVDSEDMNVSITRKNEDPRPTATEVLMSRLVSEMNSINSRMDARDTYLNTRISTLEQETQSLKSRLDAQIQVGQRRHILDKTMRASNNLAWSKASPATKGKLRRKPINIQGASSLRAAYENPLLGTDKHAAAKELYEGNHQIRKKWLKDVLEKVHEAKKSCRPDRICLVRYYFTPNEPAIFSELPPPPPHCRKLLPFKEQQLELAIRRSRLLKICPAPHMFISENVDPLLYAKARPGALYSKL
ncbi:hypothetical protein BDP27DRAFT_1477094 [Rhodocollybia butyracea]|uniref:Uncharacterized protein n=1 Tax=Rhodocollybia butyracea TaxID=206335 RepID=A0A9P5Q3W1_9AGAR|nr:hypothetical protein BDP27DRAFT_1477094 [Rhodocollybia butyracea]